MSSKEQITLWAKGLKLYDAGNLEGSLKAFEQISYSSKVTFNIGCIMIKLGRYDQAIAAFTKALKFDAFFSLAYFVRGACLYILNIVDEALSDANDSIRYLRGNMYIDYTQLGFKYKLYSSVAYFNRGLYLSKLGETEEATSTLKEAARMAENTEDVDLRPIMQVLRTPRGLYHEELEAYTIPPNILFTPPVDNLLNADKKLYIPKAQVVAAEKASDSYAGFSGREKEISATSSIKRLGSSDDGSIRSNFRPRSGGSKPLNLSIKNSSSSAFTKLEGQTLRQDLISNQSEVKNFNSPAVSSRELETRGTEADAIHDIINDIVDDTKYTQATASTSFLSTVPRLETAKNTAIKVKLHKDSETKVLTVQLGTPFDEFKEKVVNKVKIEGDLLLQYKDEDGDMINIGDEEDYNIAIQSAKECRAGNLKIELWCK